MEGMGPRQTEEVGKGMSGRGKEHQAMGLDAWILVLHQFAM